MSYTDTRLQKLAANVVGPGVVVVVISSTGRVGELIEVADKARERGAKVVAISASQSPLARKADVALIVDHDEDVATQLPMIGRILFLLMIDILAVGVAMRRGVLAADAIVALDEPGPGQPLQVTQRTSAGVGTAAPFAHLTTHSRDGAN